MLVGKKDQPPQYFLHNFAMVFSGDRVGDLIDPLDNFPVLAVNHGNANAVSAFVPGQMVFFHGRAAMALCGRRRQGGGHITFLSEYPIEN